MITYGSVAIALLLRKSIKRRCYMKALLALLGVILLALFCSAVADLDFCGGLMFALVIVAFIAVGLGN
ncbi:MAG: hypothetical protein A2383_00365 [Candidatus Pacebacteria bacterium RIFOXYB1_FULL_39_46]|nr:MAG: hypothetical protein A2383_00365 [Candidatus Pacebacteria bacterium RIFOXYB1_FULL_39_46]